MKVLANPNAIGNQFWKQRSTHGRKPIFKDCDVLWDACEEYFDYVESNPLQEQKINFYQGIPKKENINKMQAMTLDGLLIFLGVCYKTWQNYKKKDDFVLITTRVEMIIRHQKFTGAAADLLNPNIIARDLGLSDKKEIDSNVKTSGYVVQTEPMPIEKWEKLGAQSQKKIDEALERLTKGRE